MRKGVFIGCTDFVSLTDKLLMARNLFRIFTENNPAQGPEKKKYSRHELLKQMYPQISESFHPLLLYR